MYKKIKDAAQKSTKASKDLAKKGTLATKRVAKKGAEKGKTITKKGTAASKDLAIKGATLTKGFVRKGSVATAQTSKLLKEYTAGRAAELSSFFAQADILQWTKEITEKVTHGKATIYDKALDAEYIKTHIGGGHHRFFDGGHDLVNAWERVKEASTEDTFAQEVIGYSAAIWKDVVTPMGLPFATLDKASFEQWADKLTQLIPGVDKAYLYDLLSFDVMEVFSTCLGTVGAIFCLEKQDQEKLSEILAAMGIQSVISANPIMALFMVAITAYAYFVKKTKFDKKAMLKSGTVVAVSASLFAIMGMPILIELVIVITLTSILRKQILNNEQLLDLIKKNTRTARLKSNKLITHVTSQMQQITIQTAVKKQRITIAKLGFRSHPVTKIE